MKSRYASPFSKIAHAICRCSSSRFGLAILFVPTQIEPLQALENRIERGLRIALDVGVVNAQDHRPVVVPGVEPVENEGSRAANMQIARRRGGETNSQHEISGYRRRRGQLPLCRTNPQTRGSIIARHVWRWLEWRPAARGRKRPTDYCESFCVCGGSSGRRTPGTAS